MVVATNVTRDVQLFEKYAYFSSSLVFLCALRASVADLFNETAKSGALAIKPSIYQG